MMLNLMEPYPLAEYGFHSPKALHVMIEAKKLAYADMLTYVGDQRFAKVPVPEMLDKTARDRAREADRPRQGELRRRRRRTSRPSPRRKGNDTIYLSVVDKDGNIVSLIQSNYMGFGSGLVPKDTGFMLHNRGGLFTLEPNAPNTLAPRKRPLHTIIPGFMEKDGVRIGFGIMGGWNQAQAHAQFVVEHRRLRHDHPAGARSRPLHQGDVRRLRRRHRRVDSGSHASGAHRARSQD